MSKGAGIQTLSLITSRNEGYHTRIALTGDVHEREFDSFDPIQPRSWLRL
ncbi:hypothetical protein I3Q_07960 [Escherichia coli O103 str. RM8385]|nr:hypothetical protein I3Q_07960 [Escherichia coli O103 str. RM8385]